MLGVIAGPVYVVTGGLLASRVPDYPLLTLGFGHLILTDVGDWQRLVVVLCGAMKLGLAVCFFRAVRGVAGIMLAATAGTSGLFLALTAVFLPDPVGSETTHGMANLTFAALGMALTAVSALAHAAWAQSMGCTWARNTDIALASVIVVGSVLGAVSLSMWLAETMLWLAAVSAWVWVLIAAAQTRHWVGSVWTNQKRVSNEQ